MYTHSLFLPSEVQAVVGQQGSGFILALINLEQFLCVSHKFAPPMIDYFGLCSASASKFENLRVGKPKIEQKEPSNTLERVST